MTQPPTHRTYILDLFSDQATVRDLVKGILHTIFFHRYFSPIKPSLYIPSASSSSTSAGGGSGGSGQTSLAIPLPAIDVPEISAAIDTHAAALMAQLTSPSPSNVPPGGSRGEIVVRFYDRKRRKTGYTGGWLGKFGGGGAQTDEEVCWEEWCLQVVVARPRSEADRIKVRRAMESSLTKTAMKIVSIVNRDKDHIPPITTSEQNPFPYRIEVNPKQQQPLERGFGGWN